MKFSSAILLAISAIAAPYLPYGGVLPATGLGLDGPGVLGNYPNSIMSNKISGGWGHDNIDDRDIQVNVNGQNQDSLGFPGAFPYAGLGLGATALPFAGLGHGVGLPYAGLGLGAALPYAGLGLATPCGVHGLGCNSC